MSADRPAPPPAGWMFHLPVKIIFGTEAWEAIDRQVGDRRALVVSSEGFQRRGSLAELEAVLGSRLADVICAVTPNPDVATLVKLCAAMRAKSFSVIVALGGGSVIDTAKTLSVGARAELRSVEAARNFLAGGGKAVFAEAIPVIAVPTTAGTGSEVTPFATVWDHELRRKFSMDGPGLYPEAAILDPALTYSLGALATCSTGLDAVSQALEGIWNKRANPLTTAVATESLRHSLWALPRLAAAGGEAEARRAMLLASLLAGMVISQTRTGMAHSMSYPLTAEFGLPHGLACGFTLPSLLEFNLRHDDGRLAALARALDVASAEALVKVLRDLLAQCGVPERLRAYLPAPAAVTALAGDMLGSARANNNMVPVDQASVERILESSLGA
jgi:phosphonate metabolism-associated iron-containing alcohol dehydrogenase